MITRRSALALTAASMLVPALGPTVAFGAEGQMHDVNKLMAPKGFADHPLGPKDAKVTVIEYASPTCPHCAAFHKNTYESFRTQYVESGKVQFILRPFIRHIFDAVVFMLADAAGAHNWHKVVDTYFNTFDTWTQAAAPRDAMLAMPSALRGDPGRLREVFTNLVGNTGK